MQGVRVFSSTSFAIVAVSVLVVAVGSAHAAPIFFGPTPYLSSADIPAGFYAGGSPTALEDFEDGVINFGLTTNGSIALPGSSSTAGTET